MRDLSSSCFLSFLNPIAVCLCITALSYLTLGVAGWVVNLAEGLNAS